MKRIDPVISFSLSYSRHSGDDVNQFATPSKRISWMHRLLACCPIQLIASRDAVTMQPAPSSHKPVRNKR